MKRTLWVITSLVTFVLLPTSAPLAGAAPSTGGIRPTLDEVTSEYGTASRHNSWGYWKLTDPSRGYDTEYVPQPSDYADAIFMGYVSTPDDGAWGGADFTCCDNTFYIFRARLVSRQAITIPLRLGGDDGHALVINGETVGGAGFAIPVDYDLHLPARTPVLVEVAGFNGPSPWIFELTRRDTGLSILSGERLRIIAAADDT